MEAITIPVGAVLIIIFAVGLLVLNRSRRGSAAEWVGAILVLMPVMTFLLVVVLGLGAHK